MRGRLHWLQWSHLRFFLAKKRLPGAVGIQEVAAPDRLDRLHVVSENTGNAKDLGGSMSAISILMSSAGGLALFLYGLRVLSTALKRVVGARMVSLFERLTGRAHRGLIVGAATSSMLQSSSMTMVLLIGLINASDVLHVLRGPGTGL